MDKNRAIEYLKRILRIDSVEGEAKEGMPFGEGVYACLETALTLLKDEGFARELIRLIQSARKKAGLSVDDRIKLSVSFDINPNFINNAD